MNYREVIQEVLRQSDIAEAVLFVDRILLRYVRATPKEKAVEKLMAGLLVKAWMKASSDSLQSAISNFLKKSGPVTESDFTKFKDSLQKDLGSGWSDDFQKKIRPLLELRYALAKKRVKSQSKRSILRKKKAVQGVTVEWNKVDQAAVDWLSTDQLYWVDSHYDRNMSDQIAGTVQKVGLEEGLGREEVGKRLEATVGQNFDESVLYWQGVAATAMTRSTVFGTTQALEDAKFKKYRFISVEDERTSEICLHLDGKVFEVKVASGIRDRLMAAKDPEEVKSISVWPSGEVLQKALNTNDPSALSGMGIAVPPLHFHCRSDIVAEAN